MIYITNNGFVSLTWSVIVISGGAGKSSSSSQTGFVNPLLGTVGSSSPTTVSSAMGLLVLGTKARLARSIFVCVTIHWCYHGNTTAMWLSPRTIRADALVRVWHLRGPTSALSSRLTWHASHLCWRLPWSHQFHIVLKWWQGTYLLKINFIF